MVNNKGISPLIATVLIIGFTIVASVIVITWLNTLITTQTNEQECKTAALSRCLATSSRLSHGYNLDSVNPDLLKAKVTNLGGDDIKIDIIYLDDDGVRVTACGTQTIGKTVPAYSTYTDPDACPISANSLTSIRFIQTVEANVGGLQCKESCGEGVVVEV
mgnify:CR=1 FL=1